MKIIATTSSGFIVEATGDELAKVMGYAGSYHIKDGNKEPRLGREIPVSPLWEALAVSRTRKEELASLANALRKVAGRVDTINQTLASPIVEVKD